MIDFKCPTCGEALSVPSSIAGQVETCPTCGNQVPVPDSHARAAQRLATPLSWLSVTTGKITAAAVAGVLLGMLGMGMLLWNGEDAEERTADGGATLTSKQGRTSTDAAHSPGIRNAAVRMPPYEVLDREVYDAPIKTQVALTLLVPGSSTPEQLRTLLSTLGHEVSRERGFRYHATPTHIFMYAYPDRERAEGGGMGWVARLAKVGQGADTKLYVRDEFLAILKQKPLERFGLSEPQRKRVFWEIVLAEDRANKEAEERFPTEPYKVLKIGQQIPLTEVTALMPSDRYRRMSDLTRIRELPPGTVIQILGRAERDFAPWYRVKARTASGASIGTGWINSVALIGQVKVDVEKQLRKQVTFEGPLLKKQKEELARKYGVSLEQLEDIGMEGITKHWPMP